MEGLTCDEQEALIKKHAVRIGDKIPSSDDKCWGELTKSEQKGGEKLGWTPLLWDGYGCCEPESDSKDWKKIDKSGEKGCPHAWMDKMLLGPRIGGAEIGRNPFQKAWLQTP